MKTKRSLSFVFYALYCLGLCNIINNEGSDDLKRQNSVVQVSVGYMF